MFLFSFQSPNSIIRYIAINGENITIYSASEDDEKFIPLIESCKLKTGRSAYDTFHYFVHNPAYEYSTLDADQKKLVHKHLQFKGTDHLDELTNFCNHVAKNQHNFPKEETDNLLAAFKDYLTKPNMGLMIDYVRKHAETIYTTTPEHIKHSKLFVAFLDETSTWRKETEHERNNEQKWKIVLFLLLTALILNDLCSTKNYDEKMSSVLFSCLWTIFVMRLTTNTTLSDLVAIKRNSKNLYHFFRECPYISLQSYFKKILILYQELVMLQAHPTLRKLYHLKSSITKIKQEGYYKNITEDPTQPFSKVLDTLLSLLNDQEKILKNERISLSSGIRPAA